MGINTLSFYRHQINMEFEYSVITLAVTLAIQMLEIPMTPLRCYLILRALLQNILNKRKRLKILLFQAINRNLNEVAHSLARSSLSIFSHITTHDNQDVMIPNNF